MSELDEREIFACALAMPTPAEPLQNEWVAEILHAVPKTNEDIFLVGHSLGVPAILRYLEALPETGAQKFGGVFLISGPVEKRREPVEDNLRKLKNFFETPFDFKSIKNKSKYFCVIHGEDDARVDFSNAVTLSRELNCELVPVPRGGHLNRASGFTKLPPLLEKLLAVI